MLKFPTQYDPSERVYSEPGSPVKTLYSPVFDKHGIMSLEESGKHDLYAEIQSHADSVDIHIILQRFESGDVSVLSRVQGTYGDFTQMPKTFAEALNTLIAAEQYFMSLPVDTRAQFGHDFNQFIASMDSSDFAQRMGIDPKLPQDASPSASPSGSAAPSEASSSVSNTEGQ